MYFCIFSAKYIVWLNEECFLHVIMALLLSHVSDWLSSWIACSCSIVLCQYCRKLSVCNVTTTAIWNVMWPEALIGPVKLDPTRVCWGLGAKTSPNITTCHTVVITLQWRHNGHDGVSNHQPHVVYSTVYLGSDQRKHQSSASLALCGEFTGDRWIPHTNCQLRGKCFHLMTSSCSPCYPECPGNTIQTWVFILLVDWNRCRMDAFGKHFIRV